MELMIVNETEIIGHTTDIDDYFIVNKNIENM